MGEERLGPSYFLIPLVLGPLNSLVWWEVPLGYIALGCHDFCFCKNKQKTSSRERDRARLRDKVSVVSFARDIVVLQLPQKFKAIACSIKRSRDIKEDMERLEKEVKILPYCILCCFIVL